VICLADDLAGFRGQVFPQSAGMHADGLKGDDLYVNGGERQEPEEVFPERDTAIVIDVVAVLRSDTFVVHMRVAKADRYYVGLRDDGGIK
jgi:hypothetical protein